MANSKITPSPALIASADTSIAECVRMMSDRNVGSILVVSEEGPADLVGIFTERDLVKKVELFVHQEKWDQPIRTVMSQPVRTLDLKDIDQAAQFMLKHNIRHIPVTMIDPSLSKQIVAGVISMRDLFKLYVKNEGSLKTAFGRLKQATPRPKAELPQLSVFSKDPNFTTFIQAILRDFAVGTPKFVDLLQESDLDCDLLIVDLDQMDTKFWSQLLRKENHNSQIQLVMIVFDPELQPSGITRALERIGQSDKFAIFKKPIDVLQFFERMSEGLGLG
jgi:predicted transcriptional regulator